MRVRLETKSKDGAAGTLRLQTFGTATHEARADSVDNDRLRCRPGGARSSTCTRWGWRAGRRVPHRRGDDRADARGDGERSSSRRASWSTQYLIRIALYQNRLHAAIAVNPRRSKRPRQLDRERAEGKIRGPLHGIPIALKDNIHTTEMPTTGGALAFAGYMPPYEATLTKNLHNAGAIIIAKTGLTELANWVAGNPTPMPGNYNAVGGFGYNPYDPRPDPREATFDGRPALQTGGSSSGHRHRGQLLGGQRRHRYRRLGHQPVERQHAGRHPADHRTHQPLRRHSDYRGSRHRRPDGTNGRRCGDSASARSKARRPIRNDPATTACTPPPGRDYTKFLKRRRPQGRTHRHPARVLLRSHLADRRSLAPADRRPGSPQARRPQPGAGQGRWPKRSPS